MNDEAGRAEFVSITGEARVGGEENGKTFSTNLTRRDTKIFLE